MVQGVGPSARYAHTLSLVANRFLVAMGGNDGKSTLGDAWALDTSEKVCSACASVANDRSPTYVKCTPVHTFCL